METGRNGKPIRHSTTIYRSSSNPDWDKYKKGDTVKLDGVNFVILRIDEVSVEIKLA